MAVLRALFWLWVVGSLAVLVYRWWRRREVRRTGTGTSGIGSTAPASSAGGADAALRTLPTGPAGRDGAGWGSTGPGPATVPPGSVPSQGRPGPGADEATGSRRGLFASDADRPLAATIAAALEGIALPCGLTPVVDSDSLHLADKRVVFTTNEASAAEVGAAVGDALEQLGYELRSLDDATAIATRPDATVELRLHPRAGAPGTDGRPAFPTLPEEAVVLVCELRRT